MVIIAKFFATQPEEEEKTVLRLSEQLLLLKALLEEKFASLQNKRKKIGDSQFLFIKKLSKKKKICKWNNKASTTATAEAKLKATKKIFFLHK